MIDLKELSTRLKVHPNTIRNYIKDGMPCIQLKRKYLFDYARLFEPFDFFNEYYELFGFKNAINESIYFRFISK